jgi:hypothetical protein
MKLLKTVLSSVAMAIVLSSCHGDIRESSTKTVNVDDVALSDMPGYTLHGVYLYRENSVIPDRVYFASRTASLLRAQRSPTKPERPRLT